MQNGKLFATLKRHDSFSLCFGTKRAKKKGKRTAAERKKRNCRGNHFKEGVEGTFFSHAFFILILGLCVCVHARTALPPLCEGGRIFHPKELSLYLFSIFILIHIGFD